MCKVISSLDSFEWPLRILIIAFYLYLRLTMKSLLLFPLVNNTILLRQTWDITISYMTTEICLLPHPETHKTHTTGCPRTLFSCQTLRMPTQSFKNCHPLNQNHRQSRTQTLQKLKPHPRVELRKSRVDKKWEKIQLLEMIQDYGDLFWESVPQQ